MFWAFVSCVFYDGASFEYFPYDKDRKHVWTYSRPPKEYYDGQDRVWMKELRHDENFISMAFPGLNYANPSHTYYKYRLKNYEEGWTETRAASLGRAVYTGLRPGTYELEVYAAGGDKAWSKEPARLSIVVPPSGKPIMPWPRMPL